MVFDVLKAKSKALFRLRMHRDPLAVRTKQDGVKDMITAWNDLSYTVIEEAWEFRNDE
jgi:hypothetical protein